MGHQEVLRHHLLILYHIKLFQIVEASLDSVWCCGIWAPHKAGREACLWLQRPRDPYPPAQTPQCCVSRYLVGAPVVQGNGGEAKDDPRPGDVSSDGVSEDMEGVRAWHEALHWGSPVPFRDEGWLGLRVPAL